MAFWLEVRTRRGWRRVGDFSGYVKPSKAAAALANEVPNFRSRIIKNYAAEFARVRRGLYVRRLLKHVSSALAFAVIGAVVVVSAGL